MAKEKSRGGGAGGGKKSVASAPAASGSSGGAALDKACLLLCRECAVAFSCYKKGNVKQGTKELERLLKLHPAHPLPHYAYVRMAHKMALEQSQEAILKRQFKACHDRAEAALSACPNSLVVRLLFAQVHLDDPFLELREGVRTLQAACAPAHRPTPTAEASTDLKLAKAIATTFDEVINDLPVFPDLRKCGANSVTFSTEAEWYLSRAVAMAAELRREPPRNVQPGHRKLAGGGDPGGSDSGSASHTSASEQTIPSGRTLAHFLRLRGSIHGLEVKKRCARKELRARDRRLIDTVEAYHLQPASALPASSRASSEDSAPTSTATIGATDAAGIVDVEDASNVEAIVAAMVGHPESALVQRRACGALHHIFYSLNANTGEFFRSIPQIVYRASNAGAFEAIVAAMSRHSGNSVVQELACAALADMTLGSEKLVFRAGEAGVVEAVVAAVSGHVESLDVQRQAHRLVFSLTNEVVENVIRAGNAGAVEAIVAVICRHACTPQTPRNIKVQELACSTLNTLVLRNAHNQTRAGTAGAVETLLALVTATQWPVDYADEQEDEHVSALCKLLHFSAENQVRAGKAGAVEAMVLMMRTHADTILAQIVACAVLHCLVQSNPEFQSRAGTAGAVEAVTAALREHPESDRTFQDLEEGACRVLYFLVLGNLANQILAAEEGAIEVVVAVMRRREECNNIQIIAYRIIHILINVNLKNKTRAVRAGAVDAVVSAICRHTGNQQEMEEADGAITVLRHLTSSGVVDIMTQTQKARAITAVVALMRAHLEIEGVQRPACGALRNLTSGFAEAKSWAGDAGAIEVVVAAMHAHAMNEALQTRACGALRNLLSSGKGNITRALNAGAVDVVVTALRGHRASQGVQERACGALRNLLSGDAENYMTKAQNVDAVWAVVAALLGHTESALVQLQACAALRSLTSINVENKTIAGNAGAIERMVAALRRHPECKRVLGQACAALWNVCNGNANNKTLAQNAGAKDLAEALLTVHCGSKRVVKEAKYLIKQLSDSHSLS